MARKKKDYQNNKLDQNFISKDSVFRFRCAECGDCCRNVKKEDKIILSPVDIYRAANYLDIEIDEVLSKYCDMLPGDESMLPLVVLKERLDGSCSFLKKGRCTIHQAKPIVCSLYPLGRMLFFNDVTKDQEFRYYLNEFDCAAGRDEEHRVQDWLDRFDIEEYDECVKLYKRLGSVCSRLMHEAKSLQEQQEIFQTAFFLIYVKYDRHQPLQPQIEMNLAFIQSLNPQSSFRSLN